MAVNDRLPLQATAGPDPMLSFVVIAVQWLVTEITGRTSSLMVSVGCLYLRTRTFSPYLTSCEAVNPPPSLPKASQLAGLVDNTY